MHDCQLDLQHLWLLAGLFAFCSYGAKILFGSVKPSPTTLVHVAIVLFKFDYANKKPKPKGFGIFMELLARFELATSSLPRMRSTG